MAGWREGELRVKVTAPPEDGKANSAVCKLLGKRLGVPKSAVRVVRGETARHKQVEIDGIDSRTLAEVFGDPPGSRS